MLLVEALLSCSLWILHARKLDKSRCLGTRMVLDARLLSEPVPLETTNLHFQTFPKLVGRMLKALVHRL